MLFQRSLKELLQKDDRMRIELKGLELLISNIDNERLKKVIMRRLPRHKFNFFGGSNHTEKGTHRKHTDYHDKHLDKGHTDHTDKLTHKYNSHSERHYDANWPDHDNDYNEHTELHKDRGHNDHEDTYRHTDYWD